MPALNLRLEEVIVFPIIAFSSPSWPCMSSIAFEPSLQLCGEPHILFSHYIFIGRCSFLYLNMLPPFFALELHLFWLISLTDCNHTDHIKDCTYGRSLYDLLFCWILVLHQYDLVSRGLAHFYEMDCLLKS